VADELGDVVPRTLTIRTRSGRTFTLHEPSMVDIVEGEALLERDLGHPMPFLRWFASEGVSFRVFGTAMWLAARKDGLTEQQVRDKEWPFSRDEFLAMVSLHDCYEHLKDVVGFFTPAAGVLDALDETSSGQSGSESATGGA